MSSPITFTVKGLKEVQRGFRSLKNPELTKTVKPAISEGSKKLLVPAIKSKAPRGPAPHRSAKMGKRGRKGPLNKKVTTKLVKRRYLPRGVLVGYSTAPRAWYRHLVIQGTQRHSLAKDSKVRGGIGQNKTPIHEGSRANDFVGRARKATEAPFVRSVNEAIMRVYKQRSKGK